MNTEPESPMRTQIARITNIEENVILLDYPFWIDEATQTVQYIDDFREISLEDIVDVLEQKDIDDIDDNGLNNVVATNSILAVILLHTVGRERTHDLMWKLSKVGGINQLAVDFRQGKTSLNDLTKEFAESGEDFTIFQ